MFCHKKSSYNWNVFQLLLPNSLSLTHNIYLDSIWSWHPRKLIITWSLYWWIYTILSQ
jgi:hypothetical protein